MENVILYPTTTCLIPTLCVYVGVLLLAATPRLFWDSASCIHLLLLLLLLLLSFIQLFRKAFLRLHMADKTGKLLSKFMLEVLWDHHYSEGNCAPVGSASVWNLVLSTNWSSHAALELVAPLSAVIKVGDRPWEVSQPLICSSYLTVLADVWSLGATEIKCKLFFKNDCQEWSGCVFQNVTPNELWHSQAVVPLTERGIRFMFYRKIQYQPSIMLI